MNPELKNQLANHILRKSIEHAQGMFQDMGGLEPYAMYINSVDSQFNVVAPPSYTYPNPLSSDEQIAILKQACEEMRSAGKTHGFAVIYDATLTSPDDGKEFSAFVFNIIIEQKDSTQVAVPYTIHDGKVTLDKPFRIR